QTYGNPKSIGARPGTIELPREEIDPGVLAEQGWPTAVLHELSRAGRPRRAELAPQGERTLKPRHVPRRESRGRWARHQKGCRAPACRAGKNELVVLPELRQLVRRQVRHGSLR